MATDIAHAVPMALFASAGHMAVGNVDFELLSWLLFGSFPGVYLGATLSSHLNQNLVRIILTLILTCTSIKLIIFT